MSNIASFFVEFKAKTTGVEGAMKRVRGQLTGLGSSFRNIRNIAAGILTADIFRAGIRGLKQLATGALEVTATMQLLGLQIHSLAARELAKSINATRENTEEWVTATQVFDQAGDNAKDMITELKKIALISPYSMEATNDILRLSLAFGWGSKTSMNMTRSMLDLGAGIGATNDMLHRMTFNFAQIRMQGKIMSRDFWELGKAGFDLQSVLDELARTTGLNIKTHKDFNAAIRQGKVTWEDFAAAFSSMVEKDFGGAARRMMTSLTGIKNNLKDVFLVTIPTILEPTAEYFGEWAQKGMTALMSLIESGELEKMGEDLRVWVEDLIEKLQVFVPRVQDEFDKARAWTAPIIDTLKTLYDSAIATLQPLVDWIKDTFIPGMGDMVEAVKPEVLEFLDALGESFLEIADSLISMTTSVDKDVFESLSDAIVGLLDYLTEHSDTVAQFIVLLIALKAIAPIITLVKTFGETIATGGGAILTFLGAGSALVPLITTLTTTLGPAISTLGPLGAIAGDAIMAIGGALASVAPFLIPIAIAIGLLYLAWTNNWGGIQEKTATAIAFIKTKFEELKAKVAELWTTVSTKFQEIRDVVAEKMMAIGQVFTDAWGILVEAFGPIFESVFGFIEAVLNVFREGYLVIGTIMRLIGTVVDKIFEVMIALWDNVVRPAISRLIDQYVALGKKIMGYLIPKIRALVDWYKIHLAPIIKTVISWFAKLVVKIKGPVTDATTKIKTKIRELVKNAVEWLIEKLDGLARALNNVGGFFVRLRGKIGSLISKIKGFKLPSWLKPGSPTPLEIGLVGINKRLDQTRKKMRGAFRPPGGVGANGMNLATRTTHVGTMSITINGVTDPERVAQLVEERIAYRLRMQGVSHVGI
jgi:tape measure domain-containing protein